MSSLAKRKQSPEHIAKRVATRKLKNSYAGQNLGHKPTNTKPNRTSFKNGSTPWNKGKKINLDIELIKKQYLEEQKSTYDISKELNVSPKTIEGRLKELGIKLRRRGEHTDLTIQKIKDARANQVFPLKDTSIEVKIQEFLKLLDIPFITHKQISDILHPYQCDFLIPSLNLIIECDGDYWHNYPDGREIDKIRTKELTEKGFKVIRLWEYEIKLMDINEFEERLNE